jgi:hypothetical protein
MILVALGQMRRRFVVIAPDPGLQIARTSSKLEAVGSRARSPSSIRPASQAASLAPSVIRSPDMPVAPSITQA